MLNKLEYMIVIKDPILKEKYKNHQLVTIKHMDSFDGKSKHFKDGDWITYTYTNTPPYDNAIFVNGELLRETHE